MRMLLTVATALVLASAPAHAALAVNVRLTTVAEPERAAYIELIEKRVRDALRDANVRHVDVSVTKLVIEVKGDQVDVSAKIECAISKESLVSMAISTASFKAPRNQRAAALRREALGYALDSLHKKLRALPSA